MSKFNRRIGTALSCLSEIIIGILLLINPTSFTSFIMITLGIFFVIFGLVGLIQYFRTDAETASRESNFTSGILLIMLGIIFIKKQDWLVSIFPLLTGFYGFLTLINGISKLQWTIDMLRLKRRYWYLALLSAVLTIAFAIMILVNPFTATSILWIFIGVTLIIEAILDVITYAAVTVANRRSKNTSVENEETNQKKDVEDSGAIQQNDVEDGETIQQNNVENGETIQQNDVEDGETIQ